MLDYRELLDSAESRGIKVAEGFGPDIKDGVRFSRSGTEWIIINYSLSAQEKTRALGFLLNPESEKHPYDISRLKTFTRGQGKDFLMSIQCARG